ncbi:MAG: glycosyltransferase [Bdellovibrionales bacterium]|nr:glycosyltransferase [Bdellovibrionales bacterium]
MDALDEVTSQTIRKRRVTVLIRHYLPGFKSGGPLRSITNLVEQLSDQLEFSIITSDRDLLDKKPYPELKVGGWNSVGKSSVFYLTPLQIGLWRILSAIKQSSPDVIYLNSFFDPFFSILPLFAARLGMFRHIQIILAPRGEISPGALGIKAFKKRLYLALFKLLGMDRMVTWHFSTELEKEEFERIFGAGLKSQVAQNLTTPIKDQVIEVPKDSVEDSTRALRVVFLSRISVKKNLNLAIEVLKAVKSRVEFCIYGPVEDQSYWRECQNQWAALPPNVTVSYRGALVPSEVVERLGEHDLFLFPTRGENFGHVIIESLMAGVPVLTSDTVPWQELEERGAGWTVPLSELGRYSQIIDLHAAVGPLQRQQAARQARAYASEIIASSKKAIEANKQLFLAANQ